MSDRRSFTITLLRRDPEGGFWRAHVTNGGTYDVDRRHGSWMATVDNVRREVMPDIAKALQERVRPLEHAERQAEKAAAEASKQAGRQAA